jgi:hypothetical protein
MREYPKQFWVGCMSHEISLYMGDVAKLKCTKRLRLMCNKLRNWVMNHADILKVFKEKVVEYYTTKQAETTDTKEKQRYAMRKKMVLYKPGDTRMLSVFKLLFRTFILRDCIIAMFSSSSYKSAAQKAMAAYNSGQKDQGKKFKRASGGKLKDTLAPEFANADSNIWTEIELWLQANVSTVYFHRIVDTHAPSLHMVYYCSCLLDKHLRLLTELDPDAEWLGLMQQKFQKRWERWHRTIHTAAYHANPQFQQHKISDDEETDCRVTFERIWPDDADEIMAGLLQFKRSRTTLNEVPG